MGFATPLVLAALAAIAIPVLVHLVRREDREGRGFPSLMFLERVPFEVRSRQRLRDRTLLALRCLALIALVLAFAGPSCPQQVAGGGVDSRSDLVIVLDRSYSMSSAPRRSEARERIAEILGRLGAGARVALVGFDDVAEVLVPLTSDTGRVAARVDALGPGNGGTRLEGALDIAQSLLRRGDATTRGIAIVSDLQRSALTQESRLELPDDVALELHPITAPVARNVAVLDARLAPNRAGGPDDTLRVTVANTGREPMRAVRLEVRRDGHVDDSPRVFDLAPGEERALDVPLVLAADRHTRISLALIADDDIAADDEFDVVLAPRRPIDVAVVGPSRRRDDRGVFVEEALQLVRAPLVRIKRLSVDDLSDTLLAPFAVVILNDVTVPAGSPARALAAFVSRGGGVLAALGPDSDDWPADAREALAGRPGRVLRRSGARIAAASPGDGAWHPLWSLADDDAAGLFPAARVNSVRALEIGASDIVLARLHDATALLVARSHGSGHALVLATTLDPRWSTLALEPGFVSFVDASLRFLSGRALMTESMTSGETIDVANRVSALADADEWRAHLAAEGRLVVEAPDGTAERLPSGTSAFRARAAGIYEVHRGGAGTSLPLAVNVDRRESLLAAITPQELESRIERKIVQNDPREHDADGNAPATRRVAWWLLLLAALLLIAESLLARRVAVHTPASGARTAGE